MKPLKTVTLLLVLAPAFVALQAKPKKPNKLPAVFNQARYVYVEAEDGQQFDPRLLAEDRQAIADVQKALQDWNRYTLTVRRGEADLIFVVRRGRVADADVGVLASSGPQGAPQPGGASGPSHGVSAGGDMGPADDFLEVLEPNPGNSQGIPRWERTLPNGLDSPGLMLFRQLKDEVERDYPSQTASQPASQPQKP